MSETPEHPTSTTPPAAEPARPSKQNRVTQAAAWVGILAGVVFIVAVIFGTGFMLGAHSGHGGRGGHGGFDRHHGMMFHRDGPPMGPWGQFERPGPGGPGSQPPQSPQPPTTTAPARP
jgi:hypothetical protein